MSEPTYKCSVPFCGTTGLADRMFNLERGRTNGELVVVCGRDAAEARKRDIRAYRLSETFRLDAEREERRIKAGAFFAAFEHAKKAAPRGRTSSPLPSAAG